jgi:uncharacterized membrane protein
MHTKHDAAFASNLQRINLMFGVPIHKFLIHFPIALTVIALIYDSWALYAKKPELHRTGYGLTLWAAVCGLAAVGTGLQLAEMVHIDKGAVTGHAGFGLSATIFLVVLAGLRYSAQARDDEEKNKGYQIGWLVLEIGAAALVLAAAVTGHRL